MAQYAQKRQLAPWLDLREELQGLTPLSVQFGPNGDLYILAIVPTQNAVKGKGNNRCPEVSSERRAKFVVLQCEKAGVNRFEFPDHSHFYYRVQPLPNDELLLVCPRSRYYSKEQYDRNGQVLRRDGSFVREFLLGDGIEDVQTTSTGNIWVSYFDEGVFGDHPDGRSGLTCWDSVGNLLYEYNPEIPEAGDIADCYALNVTGDNDVWCYYYTDFSLIHLRDNEVIALWHPPLSGSRGFAVEDRWVLFEGGYDNRDTFILYEIWWQGKIEERKQFTFTGMNDKPLAKCLLSMRGSNIAFLQDGICYLVSIYELL